MSNKLSIVTCQPQEAAEFLSILGRRPLGDSSHLRRISSDTCYAYDMTQISNTYLSKSALGKFELPLVFGQKLENTSDMANVILIGFAVNKDVIK
jgi:hypothetical protein